VHGVLAFSLFALGQGLLVQGFREYAGLGRPLPVLLLVTLAGTLGPLLFSTLWPDASGRARSAGLVTLVVCGWTAWWLWRTPVTAARLAVQITSAGYGLLALLIAVWLLWPLLPFGPAMHPWQFTAWLMLGGQVSVMSGQLLMLTQRHAGQLAQAARTDALTGTHNRAGFVELAARRLARAGKAGQPVALLLFDIDHFKRINDTLGHPVGDEVLRRVVRRAVRTLRPDDLLGRWGGEEFAALLVGINALHAQGAAERLLSNIGRRSVVLEDGTKLRVTVSIGLALSSPDAEPPLNQLKTLVAAADTALYAAKAAGRNQVRVSHEAVQGSGLGGVPSSFSMPSGWASIEN
jgi:diguanylate cyclase (GGDEF)-like protein